MPISKEELRKEYTERFLDVEEEAHGPRAADEAMLSMLMGEGYRDPNYPKRLADPEFSEVADIFNQWALSPPPKSYPGKASGRVLTSREMGLPFLPGKKYLTSPGRPISGLGAQTWGLYSYNPYKGQKYEYNELYPYTDRVQYRKNLSTDNQLDEDELANAIKHEFTHRVVHRSGYGSKSERMLEQLPEDNYWRKTRRGETSFTRTQGDQMLNEVLAYGMADKLQGGDEKKLRASFDTLMNLELENLGWAYSADTHSEAVEGLMEAAPLLIEDFEKYLQKQEVDRPTQLSRLKYPEWLYGDRSSMGKWLRRSGLFNIKPNRIDELEDELD
jgi:hypothetical protein